MQTRSDHAMMAEINVTPLVDVMLVLLVIFIVTAPLLMHAMPVKLPRTAASNTVDHGAHIRLSMDAAGKIYLDAHSLELAELKTQLATLKRKHSEINVQLLADERVPYGQVAKVMGIVQQTGIAKLAFVTAGEGAVMRTPPNF